MKSANLKNEALTLAISRIENEDFVGTCGCTDELRKAVGRGMPYAEARIKHCTCYREHVEFLEIIRAALG